MDSKACIKQLARGPSEQRSMVFTFLSCVWSLLGFLSFSSHLAKGNTCTLSLLCHNVEQVSLCLCLTSVLSQFMPLCHRTEYRIQSARSIGPFKFHQQNMHVTINYKVTPMIFFLS